MAGRVWVVSEVYYPDEQGTAYFMTKLAEGLLQYFDVSVLCGHPTVTARGSEVPRKEVVNGVRVERCGGTTFNKDIFALRILNLFTNSISMFLKGMKKISRNDVVLVVTGPHVLHFMTKMVCLIKGARCILRVDDVYPEALIAAGVLDRESIVAGILARVNCMLYQRVDSIVVLGRDMRELALKKLGKATDRTLIIPNWGDVEEVVPTVKKDNQLLKELGLTDKFVVQCAGNMGRAQGIENMFAAAEILIGERDIHFLFIGSGAKREWMEKAIKDRSLTNVTLLNQRSRTDQPNFLNACDIAMASLVMGMTGAGVPSRMYNIMAAGKPIIAISDEESELCMVVKEERVGWTVAPDNPEGLARTIAYARQNPHEVAKMGLRARAAVASKYSPSRVIQDYRLLVERVQNGAQSKV